MGYRLLDLISLVTFTFGALTFSVLTWFYWREWRQRRHPRHGLVFPAFTVACATAFLLNTLLHLANEDSLAAAGLSIALSLSTSVLPPLMLHLVYREERLGLPAARVWAWGLGIFYAVSAASAVAGLLGDSWSDILENAPAARLAFAGIAGLAMELASRRKLAEAERRHRNWTGLLLLLTALVAAANLTQAPPIWSLLPDYLMLAFFCVTLYYKERLIFFDLLIKRGAFFAVSLLALTTFFSATPPLAQRAPWLSALLLTPLWFAAPWMDRHLGRAIDRVWLRRRFSPDEAERQFSTAIQAANTEVALRERATEGLSAIFDAHAEVSFEPQRDVPAAPDGISLALAHNGARAGWIALDPRPDSIPYLSDDHRLLQSLARTLGVVLDNVRFREREQHLRWLTGRAELRALRAQINPHFLFNALNAIAGLIPEQPQLADETLEQLAQVFRYTLRKSQSEWVRLDEEVEFAAAYLRVEQARFGERLCVEFQVDPAAGAVSIPAMSIQPLIENAIKHGVSVLPGGGAVRLSACLVPDALAIEVADNGPGFPAGFSLAAVESNGSVHGLRNVAERLRGYYGDAAQLAWDCDAEGTRVRLRIPR